MPWLLLLVIAAADVIAHRWNLSILLTIPLLIYARHATSNRLWGMAAVIVLVTYFGLFLPYIVDGELDGAIAGYRVFNRTLVAIAVLVITAAGQYIRSVRDRAVHAAVDTMSDPDRFIFDEMISALERSLVLFSCATVGLAIAAIDMASPQTQNFSILYSTVVILASQSKSRRILWCFVAALLVLVWVGFSVSLAGEANQAAGAASVNRSLTSLAIIGVALLCHIWLNPPRPEGYQACAASQV